MLSALDNSFFYFINRGCSNHFLNVIMPFITELGGWKVLLVTVGILFFSRKKEVKTLGILLFTGLIASYAVVFILKIWFARPRPFLLLPDVNLLIRDRGFSFPSGHAANAFMAATLLFTYSKKLYYLYIAAIGVVFSRIYLGVHFPSDVIAGALLGIILGYGIRRISQMKGAGNAGRKDSK